MDVERAGMARLLAQQTHDGHALACGTKPPPGELLGGLAIEGRGPHVAFRPCVLPASGADESLPLTAAGS